MTIAVNNNLQVIESVIPSDKIPEFVSEYIDDINDKLSQVVLDNNGTSIDIYLTSVKRVYKMNKNELLTVEKSDVTSAKFITGAPCGEFMIALRDGIVWHPENIIFGRVFDFVQDTKPREINIAGYDNTIRHEFPQLLDPDHAEEVDRLRKWMQEGHISHYEYDDANPVYPKAGK
ncbi:histidine decarboxylase maturation protein HdcB [Lentilactobacillus kribbianus]|uniref:histidine decarboxylase maturation protein HdcB n=1 Tax=Lentilactobacillus kribbianus TaxID=2729622 RepID=UPI001555DB60|nr:histidine decarboxylase maturation protein HdcB [Lentilactobacillus kribbianus]